MPSPTPLFLRTAAVARQIPGRSFSRAAAAAAPKIQTGRKVGGQWWMMIGGGAVVAVGSAFAVWKETPLLPTLSLETPLSPSGRTDPSSNLFFPLSITPLSFPPSAGPPLSIVGLGVRVVSFLRVQVYSVGFYTNCRMLGGVKGTEESMSTFLHGPAPCVLRILPTRNTGFDHLRDGFVRSMQGRLKLLSKEGKLTDEENENLSTAVSSFKSIFNAASSATRGQELLLVKLPNNAGLAVEFEGEVLGKVLGVEGGVLAREMMIGYFVEKNPNSPKMRDNVREALGV